MAKGPVGERGREDRGDDFGVREPQGEHNAKGDRERIVSREKVAEAGRKIRGEAKQAASDFVEDAAQTGIGGQDVGIAEDVSDESRIWAILAHIGTLGTYIVPFANIIVPLVIYLVKKDEDSFVAHHARESLNFQISVIIYIIFCVPLVFIFIGALLIAIIAGMSVILVIVATVKTSNKVLYRYPFTMRFIKGA